MDIDEIHYPGIATKLPPLCYTTFGENGVIIKHTGSLSFEKKNWPICFLPYSEIKEIRLSVVRKRTNIIFLPGTRENLNITLEIKDGSKLHFECEDMKAFMAIHTVCCNENIPIEDPFQLYTIFHDKKITEVYAYLEENLDKMDETQGISEFTTSQIDSVEEEISL